MRARGVWLSVVLLIAMLAIAASLASADSAADFRMRLSAGASNIVQKNDTYALDYCAVNHPSRALNLISFTATSLEEQGDTWAVNIGHRFTRDRAGLNIGIGPNWLRQPMWIKDGQLGPDQTRCSLGAQISADYALTNRWGVSVAYSRHSIMSSGGPNGSDCKGLFAYKVAGF